MWRLHLSYSASATELGIHEPGAMMSLLVLAVACSPWCSPGFDSGTGVGSGEGVLSESVCDAASCAAATAAR